MVWVEFMDKVFLMIFGMKLIFFFDFYVDSLKYLVFIYVIFYVGLIGYVGINLLFFGYNVKMVCFRNYVLVS